MTEARVGAKNQNRNQQKLKKQLTTMQNPTESSALFYNSYDASLPSILTGVLNPEPNRVVENMMQSMPSYSTFYVDLSPSDDPLPPYEEHTSLYIETPPPTYQSLFTAAPPKPRRVRRHPFTGILLMALRRLKLHISNMNIR